MTGPTPRHLVPITRGSPMNTSRGVVMLVVIVVAVIIMTIIIGAIYLTSIGETMPGELLHIPGAGIVGLIGWLAPSPLKPRPGGDDPSESRDN